MRTIVITGAGGFIGRALCKYFLDKGDTVYGIDITDKNVHTLKKYRNLEQKKDWKNQKLLGNDLKFSARDLINVYVELEKEFDIHFKEKDIVAGKFDTFDDIIKLINKEIAYKTRGKEHA